MLKNFLKLGWVLICFIVLGLASKQANADNIETSNSFRAQDIGLKKIDCWFENKSSTVTECYKHFSYEVPDDPKSKVIETSVVIFKSNSTSKKLDPVLDLQGGPGQAYITNNYIGWIYKNKVLKYWLKDRDVILTEYRGLGLSNPSLKCKSFDHDSLLADSDEDWIKAYQKCHAELESLDVDLSQYHALNVVKDLVQLRKLLNIEKWNLQGQSYGSLIAMLLADFDNPATRSVIANSVWPPRFAEEKYLNYVLFPELLEQLFEQCEAIFFCENSNPDSEKKLITILKRLKDDPVKIDVNVFDTDFKMTIDHRWFLEVLFSSLYQARSVSVIPYLISTAYIEIYDKFEDELVYYIEETSLPNFSLGGHITYICNERKSTSKQDIEKLKSAQWVKDWIDPNNYCEIWTGKKYTPVLANTSVSFDVPILFISGELDPVTPALWTESILDDFKYGQRFVFKDDAHYLNKHETKFCMELLKNEFINEPFIKIDPDRCDKNNLNYSEDFNIGLFPEQWP